MQSLGSSSNSPISAPRRVPSLVDGALGYPASLLLSPTLHPSTSTTSSGPRPSCLARSLSCRSSSSTSSTGSNKSVRFPKQPVSKVHFTYARGTYDRAPIQVDENLAMRRCQEDEPRKWAENFYSIRSGNEEEDDDQAEEEENGVGGGDEYTDSESECEYGSDERHISSSPMPSPSGIEMASEPVPTLLRFDYVYDTTPASSLDSISSLPSLSSDSSGSSSTSDTCSSPPAVCEALLADPMAPLVLSPTCYSPPLVLESSNTKLWAAQMGLPQSSSSSTLTPSSVAGAGVKRASSPKAAGPACGERRKTYRRSVRCLEESDSFGCLGGF